MEKIKWCNQQGSNLRPPPSQGGALIQLSYGCTYFASRGNIAKRKKKASISQEIGFLLQSRSSLYRFDTEDNCFGHIRKDFFSIGHKIFSEKKRLIFPRNFRYKDLNMYISIFFIIMMEPKYCRKDLLWTDRCISYTDLDIIVPHITTIDREMFCNIFSKFLFEFEERLLKFCSKITKKFYTCSWSRVDYSRTSESIERRHRKNSL